MSTRWCRNEFSVAQDIWLLDSYFARPVDGHLHDIFLAMKCASLLRDAMWGMFSEFTSTPDFNYAVYGANIWSVLSWNAAGFIALRAKSGQEVLRFLRVK